MNVDTIRFPAIAFSHDNSFLVVNELPTVGTPLSFKGGYFSALQLYDSAGSLGAWYAQNLSCRFHGSIDCSIEEFLSACTSAPLNTQTSERLRQLCALVDADPDDLYPAGIEKRLLSAASPADLVRAITDAG